MTMQTTLLTRLFIEGCCYREPGLTTKARSLWEDYKEWCGECSLKLGTKKKFLKEVETEFPSLTFIKKSPQVVEGVQVKSFEDWQLYDPDEVMKIYFISDGEFIKVGISQEPLMRMAELQIGNPRRLSLLGWIDGGVAEESHLHKVFEKKYKGGEWFNLDEQDLIFCWSGAWKI